MAVVDKKTSESVRSRAEAYLNDKFQTEADFQNIDSLLAKINEQQELLRKQLTDAKNDVQTIETQLNQDVHSLRHRAIENKQQQTDLTRRLHTITRSEVSDNAVKKLDVPMQKQKRLEVAIGYLKTFQELETLEGNVRTNLEVDPAQSVNAYKSLDDYLAQLERLRPMTDDGAPHLFDHFQNSRRVLYDEIKGTLDARLRQSLEKMKWPGRELNLKGPSIEDCSKYTELLLKLQEPMLLARTRDTVSPTSEDPILLHPLVTLVNPLSLRFRYHFYGDKPTNRLDKPEYFFSHILDLLDQHNMFVNDWLQPILDGRIEQDDRLELVYTDAVSSFITALLPMVSAKSLSLLPQLTSQPQLMSHFIHEMMSFDTTIRQSWAYWPFAGPLTDWKGLTWKMLTQHGYFSSWLAVEKEFALSRYKTIRDNPESNIIDHEGIEDGKTKPTKGAIRVNDLLETITDRYRQLTSFSQKLKFLMDIQLSIFDDYHGHLHGVLQAYLVGSHTAGRYLQGQSAEDAMGIKGLEALSKIFGSAEYLEGKMADWSDDVFFLELWDELQDRASQHAGGNGAIGRDLNVEEVAAKTSATIKNVDEMLESDGGALFDETASSYRRLREQSEQEIARALDVNIRNALRPFLEVSIWSSLSTTSTDISQIAPSSALDGLKNTITILLGYLATVFAPGPLRRITRHACGTIQKEIYDKLLLKHSFSAAGANQLKRDAVAISETINATTKLPDEAQKHFRRLNDALILLNLPIRGSKSTNTVEDVGDDWGFDDEDAVEVETPSMEVEGQDWGLWQAEKAIFADNSSARKVLESKNLTELSEADARNIIKRRIEINT